MMVWGMDTLDSSHRLATGLLSSSSLVRGTRFTRRNEVSLHSVVVLVVIGSESESQNLGWAFVGFKRGRRLIPGLSGADWPITTMNQQYLHSKDLGLGLCWNVVTLTHNLWFSWRERDNLVQRTQNNDKPILHPTK